MRRDELSAEFDRLFAQLVHRATAGRFEPNADVYVDEANEQIVVVVELAGANADELRVAADERHLFIVGRRVDQTTARRGSIAQKEIQFGEFAKRIRLPLPIETEAASAVFRDGILTIALPLSSQDDIPTVHRTEIRMTVKRTFA